MSISGIQPGYAIIQQSANMAEEAAIELNQASQHSLESDDTFQASDLSFNQIAPEKSLSSKDKQPELIPSSSEALLKLTQSANYNRIGASVVDRQNDAIDRILDIHI
ncbi:hypothetical protein [Vibrio minamisatsumaniensis]|uniref:hypothetical protein n=1 Tax=Vibrio minamisatsumaniensis TaxID=2910243 RepID=UPI003D1B21C1